MADTKYGYSYDCASGPDLNDCCFLGLRYLKKYDVKPEWCESWVMRSVPPAAPGKQGISCQYSVGAWLTGFWRSPANRLYATELYGRIHRLPDLADIGTVSAWVTVDYKDFLMQGVWGLDDSCVFVWYTHKKVPGVLHWNGSKWTELPPPPGKIIWMHGSSPENVYAVGYRGLLARWDGRAWTQASLPTQENFTHVFVAGADEVYAVGHGEVLWEGSASGWGKAADGPGPLFGVAKFAGEVWVGAKALGLFKRVRNTLESVNPDIHAVMMEVRKGLLITCQDQIAATTDGKNFAMKAKGSMERMRDAKPPLFMEPPPEDEAELEDEEDEEEDGGGR